MAKSPEQELADFLAPLPRWLQKALWYDYSSMTDSESYSWGDSTNPFTASQLEELRANPGWQPERYRHTADELRPRFEELLQRCGRAEWRKYRDNVKAAREATADSFGLLPAGKRGRPRKDSEAEQLAKEHESKSYAAIAKAQLTAAGLLPSDLNPAQKELAIIKERERIRKLLASRRPKQPRKKDD